jgi:hypothetical protein
MDGDRWRYGAVLIDDVRVYNRQLSAAEVNAIYNQGVAFQQGSPEGEMPALSLLSSTLALIAQLGISFKGSAAPKGAAAIAAHATLSTAARAQAGAAAAITAKLATQTKGRGATSGIAPLTALLATQLKGSASPSGQAGLKGIISIAAKAAKLIADPRFVSRLRPRNRR